MRLFMFPLVLCTIMLNAQPVINGPMPGNTDLLEATIWMQCHGRCRAYMEFWAIDRPDSVLRTAEVIGEADKAYAMDQ